MNEGAKTTPAASRWNPLTLRIKPKFALLTVSILVSLLVAEAGLQIFFFDHVPKITSGYKNAYDSTLGWFPVPNYRTVGEEPSVTNNSMGFRGAEFRRGGKAGILFLGDSFVWGYDIPAVEDRFSDKLQARHPDWNVYNTGVVGYSTDQEFLLLRRMFDSLKPQVVFLLFCTENDRKDNSASISYGCYKPHFTTNATGIELHGVPVPCSEGLCCSEHSLLSHSYLFRLAVRVWKKITLPPPVVHEDPTLPIILEMNKYVQGKGACFVVGLTAPDSEVQQLLQAHGIPWIDLNTDKRLSDTTGHWSVEGNSFAAERIEQFLATNKVTSPFVPQ